MPKTSAGSHKITSFPIAERCGRRNERATGNLLGRDSALRYIPPNAVFRNGGLSPVAWSTFHTWSETVAAFEYQFVVRLGDNAKLGTGLYLRISKSS